MKKGLLTVLLFAVIPVLMGLSAVQQQKSVNIQSGIIPDEPTKTNFVKKVIKKKPLIKASTSIITASKPIPKKKVAKSKNVVKKKPEAKSIVKSSSTNFQPDKLYLIERAKRHIKQTDVFAFRVKEIADQLNIPPEWIMGIIDSESGFNPNIRNRRGSGALGLIQFMPQTCKEFGFKTVPESPLTQLDFIKKYLESRQKHYGKFHDFTDIKLSVLYPIAVGKPDHYVLYKSPTKAYYQNSSLDHNKDGSVTVGDVEMYMKRHYSKLYEGNA